MSTTEPTPRQRRADAYLANLRERSAPKKPPVPIDVAIAFLAVFVALIFSGSKAAAITAGVCAALIFVVLPIAQAMAPSDD